MVSIPTDYPNIRDRRSARQRMETPRIRGTRVVQHKFGRLLEAASTALPLVAIPLMPGESLRRVDVLMWACSDAGGVQPDSAVAYSAAGVIAPANWGNGTSPYNNTAAVQAVLADVFEGNLDGSFEGEPNPGGDVQVPPYKLDGSEVVFADWRLLTSPDNPSYYEVAEVLATADARHRDYYRKTVEKNYYMRGRGGMFVFGVWTPEIAAQTDFGVADLDLPDHELHRVLMADDIDAPDLSAAELKVHELLYSGDSYIESDTLKEPEEDLGYRFQGLCQALIATPWPRGR